MRRSVGFVVGLKAEARLLDGFRVGIGGGTPAGAVRAAMKLLEDGAAALVSFGFAGGLQPGLWAGQLVVPESVMVGETIHSCDAALRAWLGGDSVPRLLAGAVIAATVAEKALLHARTGAAAVDLESGAVAEVAAARGVPMAVLRAISDPAERDLPPAALVALDAGGKINPAALAWSLLRQPAQIPDLLMLARDAGAARRAISRRVRALSADDDEGWVQARNLD